MKRFVKIFTFPEGTEVIFDMETLFSDLIVFCLLLRALYGLIVLFNFSSYSSRLSRLLTVT